MDQSKLMQMALEADMTPEQIGEFRDEIMKHFVILTSRFDECESEIEKAAFATAMVMFCEKAGKL